MKILVITAMYPTQDNPAAGSFVKTQVDALRANGAEVEVLVFRGANNKLKYLTGFFQMRKRLRQGNIDVIHAHYSYVGVVARMQRSVPVVVTYHGDDLLASVADFTGRHSKFSLLMVRLGQWLGQRVEAAIVQNKQMSAKLNDAQHVHIVPHEIDFETFCVTNREEARRRLNLDPHKPYLLFAANPEIHVKRFPLAKRVTDALQRDVPDVELLVVHRETQERLALYMCACDALVFPSFQEGSPNVIKQAMACCMPIVATDVGDIRDVIASTEGCFVCSPDANEFTGRLKAILESNARTEGRAAVQHFDRPLVAQRLINVYLRATAAYNTRETRRDAHPISVGGHE